MFHTPPHKVRAKIEAHPLTFPAIEGLDIISRFASGDSVDYCPAKDIGTWEVRGLEGQTFESKAAAELACGGAFPTEFPAPFYGRVQKVR